MSEDAFNFLLAERDKYAHKDLYRSKLSTTFVKYKNYFSKLFNYYCLEEIKNHLNSKPKEIFATLSNSLKGLGSNPELAIAKINGVLQDPSHQIKVPAVINIANQLGCGKIKAKYTGTKTQNASYGDCGGSCGGSWEFDCREKPAWTDYDIKISYELKELNLSVPLVDLQFINHTAERRYRHVGRSIFSVADDARGKANSINAIPIDKLLADYWPNSVLTPGSIKVHSVADNILKRIIDSTARHLLTNTSPDAKHFKRLLLNSNQQFYFSKLDKLQKAYQLIIKYAKLAGADEEKLNLLANPISKEQFQQDIINLSLSGFGINSEGSLLDKYTKKIDMFREQVEKLLNHNENNVDSDFSSEEEPSSPLRQKFSLR
jgi:hypothetical protein